jgi:hypothetical protein
MCLRILNCQGKETVMAVHSESNGIIADEIVEVEEGYKYCN